MINDPRNDTAHMTLTVTLNAGDSINLTTGQVTRSTSDKRGDTMLRNNASFRESILRDSRSRVRRNDLSALAYVIRNGA